MNIVASSWKIAGGRFVYVHQVAGAVQFSGLSAPEQVDVLPAAGNIPAGQARIDLVVWDVNNTELVVVQGAPAVAPSSPSTSPEQVAVASYRVTAGDGMVLAARLSKTYAVTGLVQAGTDTGWVTVTSLPALAGAPRAAYRLVDEMVEITGRCRKGGGTYAIFQLPEGMRPTGELRFAAEGGADLQISANGWVASTNMNQSDVTFNIRFRVA
ncbi:MAG: hypothetical protein KKF42_04400 [Actinobacteria bacterium]|nr:hypothetical protein [Actinomycetota bacterium]